jgi:hypothetical protein
LRHLPEKLSEQVTPRRVVIRNRAPIWSARDLTILDPTPGATLRLSESSDSDILLQISEIILHLHMAVVAGAIEVVKVRR